MKEERRIKKTQLFQTVCRPRFKTWTSRTQRKSATHWNSTEVRTQNILSVLKLDEINKLHVRIQPKTTYSQTPLWTPEDRHIWNHVL